MSAERPKGWQHDLAEELKRLSDAVRRVTGRVETDTLPAAMVAVSDVHHHLAKAETIYQQRRRRAECFPGTGELFRDPAWDILLHLFIAHERGEVQTAGSAAIASGVAPRVGQRWLKALESVGLVESRQDPRTASAAKVRITPKAIEMMRCFLDGLGGPTGSPAAP